MGLLGDLGAAIGGAIGGFIGGKDGAKKGADLGRKIGDNVQNFLTGGKPDTDKGGSNGNQVGGGQQGNNDGGKNDKPSGDNNHHDDDDDDDKDSHKKRLASNKKPTTPAEIAALKAWQPLRTDWAAGNGLSQLPPSAQAGTQPLEPGHPILPGEPDEIAIPAHLYVDAKLTQLGRSVISAFIHEGLPDVGTKAEDWLKHFARYGWNPYETADAHRIYDGTMDANDPNTLPSLMPMLTFPNKRTSWNHAMAEIMAGLGTIARQQADPGTPTPAPTPQFMTNTPPAMPTTNFITNTPSASVVTTQILMTLTPTSTPGSGSDLIDLSNLLALLKSGQYKYEPTSDNIDPNYKAGILLSDPLMAEVESGKYSDIADAYNTLSKFLDPSQFTGPNGERAWWHQDGKVTVDEILALIAYHEGANSLETRQAVYARYLLYMGGDPNAKRSDISQGFTTSLDSDQHSYDLDRFLRFLSYYQPWREPGSDHIPFDTNVLPDAMIEPTSRDAAQAIQGEIQQLHSTDPTVVASVFTHNGKTVLPSGITLQNDVIPQTMNLPFQFATLDKSQWPPKIRDVISEYEIGTPEAIADAKSKVYDIFKDSSGKWAIVLTRQQAVDLGDSTNLGISVPAIETANKTGG